MAFSAFGVALDLMIFVKELEVVVALVEVVEVEDLVVDYTACQERSRNIMSRQRTCFTGVELVCAAGDLDVVSSSVEVVLVLEDVAGLTGFEEGVSCLDRSAKRLEELHMT